MRPRQILPLLIAACLTGCATTSQPPSIRPTLPADLLTQCAELPKPADQSMGALTRAYLGTVGLYEECARSVKGWAEWAGRVEGSP